MGSRGGRAPSRWNSCAQIGTEHGLLNRVDSSPQALRHMTANSASLLVADSSAYTSYLGWYEHLETLSEAHTPPTHLAAATMSKGQRRGWPTGKAGH